MEISPIKIFYMAVASLLFGMCAGALNDVNRIIRMLFGIRYGKKRFERIHNVKLPIFDRKVGSSGTEDLKKCKSLRAILPCIIFVQDVILFFFAGAGVAILNYYFNNGRARLYTPVAVIIGFAVYYFTVGRAVLYFSDIIVFVVKTVFVAFLGVIYYPLSLFVSFFGIFVKKICTNLCKAIAKKQKKVYNIYKKTFVMTNAAKGYIDLTKE